MKRRVVITGCGVISPLGNSPDELWNSLREGKSGVRKLQRIPSTSLPVDFGGEAWDFGETIDGFGPLDPSVMKQIRKGLKIMCREIKMGVAAAQLALNHSTISLDDFDRNRIGCVYGSDFITTEPVEFVEAVRACANGSDFDYKKWADSGLAKITPLWLLKYLPNMPACHVAIYNDLRGPNNSITMREASSNLAIAEAVSTISRGAADVILAGATGTRIHPLRTVHTIMQEQLAMKVDSPETASRPFDRNRQGMVIGEGAAAIVLEELETAKSRGATILAEVIGYGASTVMDRNSIARRDIALSNTIRQTLSISQLNPKDIGHVHAHGLGTSSCDKDEAKAISETLGSVPVVAAKANFGNLGAASGLVETIASIAALNDGKLFKNCNYETPDPECPISIVTDDKTPAGCSFINLNVSPQGQSSAIAIRRFD